MNNHPDILKVPDKLKGFISKLELYKQKANDTLIHTMLPLGKVQILFQFGNTIKHKTKFTDGWKERPDIFIGGPYDYAYELAVNPGSQVLAIHFKPTKFRYFSPYPISALKNKLIKPDEIWGKKGKQFTEQISQHSFETSLADIVENFLTHNYQQNKTSPIENLIPMIYQKRGICKVSNLAKSANLSISRFRQRFQEEMGLSPKSFLKIIRINALIRYFFLHRTISLTSLAYEFDYFDQSHFIKDFKLVVGKTPARVLKSCLY